MGIERVSQGKVVQVRFPNTKGIWDTVVTNSKENGCVDEENTNHFVMEYDTVSDFHNAQRRFEGSIEYTVLTPGVT